MNNSVDSPSSHFIAINFHGFHEANTALDCVRSALSSAKGLSGPVELVFFHPSNPPLPNDLVKGLEALSVTRMGLPESSNGERLNAQLQKSEGFSFFYRVDADDLVSKDRFKWQSAQFLNSGCDICGGGLVYHNIETGERSDIFPPERPGILSYLFNHHFLHPSLAFRLETFKLQYSADRLEDKELALLARRANLIVRNDQRIYGTYNLNPNARNGKSFAKRELKLNLAYILETRKYWAMPIAFGLFALSRLVKRDTLRNIRKIILPSRSSG